MSYITPKGAKLASATSAMALVVFLPRPESVSGPILPTKYPEIPRPPCSALPFFSSDGRTCTYMQFTCVMYTYQVASNKQEPINKLHFYH